MTKFERGFIIFIMIEIQVNDGNGWRTDRTVADVIKAFKEASDAVKCIKSHWGLTHAKAEKCVRVLENGKELK